MQWELWRQDDHGSEVLVRSFDNRGEAERTRDEFSARGHTQHKRARTSWAAPLYEGMAGALPTAEWANTTIAAGDTTEEIDKLRRGGEGHIVVWAALASGGRSCNST